MAIDLDLEYRLQTTEKLMDHLFEITQAVATRCLR